MKNFIRRMSIGFRKDREELSLTISVYLNMVLIAMRGFLKNAVMIGIIGSIVYWLGYLTMSLSPNSMLTSSIWMIYTEGDRNLAAQLSLGTVLAGAFLYAFRIYEIGRFVEKRYIEEDILFSDEQVKTYSDILDQEEGNQKQEV